MKYVFQIFNQTVLLGEKKFVYLLTTSQTKNIFHFRFFLIMNIGFIIDTINNVDNKVRILY